MNILGGNIKKTPKWRLWEYLPPQNEKYIFDYTLGGDGGVLVLKIFDCALIKTA